MNLIAIFPFKEPKHRKTASDPPRWEYVRHEGFEADGSHWFFIEEVEETKVDRYTYRPRLVRSGWVRVDHGDAFEGRVVMRSDYSA